MTKQISSSVQDIIRSLKLTVKTPTNIGTPGNVVWIDPNTLHIDHNSYQRDTNEKHALKIATSYRYDRAKVISGYRDLQTGIIYVTDGQHSSVAAALAKIPLVPVYLFDLPLGTKVEELIKLQSAQFVAINKNQKKIQKYDEYRNDLLQGASYAKDINNLCNKFGITLIPSNKPKGRLTLSHMVGFIGAVTQVTTGPHAADLALTFITKYWPTDHIEGSFLQPLARFLFKYEQANKRGLPRTSCNQAILYAALTQFDKSQKKIETTLTITATDARISTYSDSATWRSRAMCVIYNEYIADNNLDIETLNPKVLL